MSTVLSILAIGVLLVLMVASWRVRHQTRATEKQQEDVRMQIGTEQHESSLRRRAEVRATPAEPTETAASHTDD
jgi:predicted Holliday junction resolvase-like endonuclease